MVLFRILPSDIFLLNSYVFSERSHHLLHDLIYFWNRWPLDFISAGVRRNYVIHRWWSRHLKSSYKLCVIEKVTISLPILSASYSFLCVKRGEKIKDCHGPFQSTQVLEEQNKRGNGANVIMYFFSCLIIYFSVSLFLFYLVGIFSDKHTFLEKASLFQ